MDGVTTDNGKSLRRSFRKALAGNGAIIIRGENRKDKVLDFAASTVAGLSASPRRLECRFLYDARGGELFDLITGQPEYYLTRTESEILASNVLRIREITGPVTIVELGSGSSVKTGYLLHAWLAHTGTVTYVPVDISEEALRDASASISKAHPEVRIIGVNTDYHKAFSLFRDVSPAIVCFLGSTIGNFDAEETGLFLDSLSGALSPGDFFLVGIDLVKDRATIEAAYNDAAGVTEEFTRNLFARMNRELKSGVDLSAVEHVARYNAEKGQVEIHARFAREQTIQVAPLERSFTVAAGEMLLVEISRKFRLERFLPDLQGFGFTVEGVFTDERNWFALVLVRKEETG